MPYRLMLDSGAFSVWTKGISIDLEEYIAFCKRHPDTSYYVNLDVIPGKPGQKITGAEWRPKGLTSRNGAPPEIEKACRLSWDNYLRMGDTLPANKVIPVFHRGDDFKWLEKYLDHGVKYIGLSPLTDRTTKQKFQWLKEVEQRTVSNGKVNVRMHGFGVTSFPLMKEWPYWYSVDSIGWIWKAAMGIMYIPMKVKGEFDYSMSPWIVDVTPCSKKKHKLGYHYDTLSPMMKRDFLDYINSINAKMGRFEIADVAKDYKLKRGKEHWHVKGKSIVKVLEKGIRCDLHLRMLANAHFIIRANRVLPVKHIYLAGDIGNGIAIEKYLDRRLFSFLEVKRERLYKDFRFHLDRIHDTK